LRDAERELDFGFSSQRADLVPNFPTIGFPVKQDSSRKAMNSKGKECSRPTDMGRQRLAPYQVLIPLFLEVADSNVRSDHHFTKRSGDMVYTSVRD
jgi:hypothetical protein